MATVLAKTNTGGRRWTALVIAIVAVIAGATCSKPAEPLKIVRVDTGTTVNADNTVSSPSETFAPNGTVYAAIETDGTGPGTLKAQWVTADGKTITEQTQQINPTGPSHFEFHFAPPEGWPKGRHKAVFTLNGTGARTREFEVR